ncbi:MAG: DDE-type integrase/transposase/recombinase [Dehalococcoidia bacterium]|nr:DDE-type integrase/transposase/recombinase [Dehalococcoidia bacterium]
MVTPSHRREATAYLRTTYGVSERRACRVTGLPRATQRYRSVADPQHELRLRLRELATVRVRCGYRRLWLLLRREGYTVNHKRVYRLYPDEGLAIRTKTPRRRRSCRYRTERPQAGTPNEIWAMDFVSDALFNGQQFRALTIVDCHSRESLAVVPRVGFRAFNVVDVLEQLRAEHGVPKTIRCDNGPEFAGQVLDQWAYFQHVELDFSRPGKPTDCDDAGAAGPV